MDPEQQKKLKNARRRVAEAMPYSPEWSAAIDGLEELERQRPTRPRPDRRNHLLIVTRDRPD